MKKFFLLMMACGAALWGRAQQGTDVLMATLQHGDEVSVYYGKTALEEAYTAAADSGDVVTLSAGVFSFSNHEFQKSLSVVGNGFVSDMENGIYPTIIEDGLYFKPRDVVDDDGEMVKEGVKVDGIRLEGLKLSYVLFQSSGVIRDFQIVKCQLSGSERPLLFESSTENFVLRQSVCDGVQFGAGNGCNHQNFYVCGSYVAVIDFPKEYCTVNVDHSLINSLYQNELVGLSLGNSIVKASNISSGVVANNCVFIDNTPYNLIGAGNWVNCKLAGIFEESMDDMAWDGVKTFKLKYPEEYVGTDGTQVGLYGGPYPYNPTPSIPQIKESHIDTTVAADGKLKVSVTVEAQTED
ncbi:hypothetical protein [Paraprevotella xylaniphila]|uniref:hypothetical protein n=1 Tax=Paraprevotella xylaniphila TaxID=454155 RepID=UPI003FD7E0B2